MQGFRARGSTGRAALGVLVAAGVVRGAEVRGEAGPEGAHVGMAEAEGAGLASLEVHLGHLRQAGDVRAEDVLNSSAAIRRAGTASGSMTSSGSRSDGRRASGRLRRLRRFRKRGRSAERSWRDSIWVLRWPPRPPAAVQPARTRVQFTGSRGRRDEARPSRGRTPTGPTRSGPGLALSPARLPVHPRGGWRRGNPAPTRTRPSRVVAPRRPLRQTPHEVAHEVRRVPTEVIDAVVSQGPHRLPRAQVRQELLVELRPRHRQRVGLRVLEAVDETHPRVHEEHAGAQSSGPPRRGPRDQRPRRDRWRFDEIAGGGASQSAFSPRLSSKRARKEGRTLSLLAASASSATAAAGSRRGC